MFDSIIKLKDSLLRKISTSFLLKYIDGYKQPIMRIWEAVNMVMNALFLLCVLVPDYNGFSACGFVEFLDLKLVLLSNLAGKIGIELTIQDRKAKKNLELVSAKRVYTEE